MAVPGAPGSQKQCYHRDMYFDRGNQTMQEEHGYYHLLFFYLGAPADARDGTGSHQPLALHHTSTTSSSFPSLRLSTTK